MQIYKRRRIVFCSIPRKSATISRAERKAVSPLVMGASFTIVDGDMKLEVRSNKVKSFDERADLAAERLVDYLKRYAMGRELGILHK